ncbi:MAG TPA: DUF4349 domain-containing protein [Gemmatimonadales bacterium]|nr:DUF4349 domain-containing protein [Gemmatimonadales bacterium]
MRPIVGVCLTTLALILAACETAREVPSPTGDEVQAAQFEPKDYAGRAMENRVAAADAAPALITATRATGVVKFLAPLERSNLLIRTAQASVEVDSLERALAKLRLLAERVGGYVASTSMQTGRGQLRAATFELKIPADRFDDALSGLAGVGKLESVNVSAEDVGEEFTDVTARMGNARRLEERLLALLATRTGKLKDVLDVEHELARVREEIDRYEGRLRYLRAHVALSTLRISVHEPIPVVGHAGSSVMGEAAKQAWRNFVELLAFSIRALGIVLPLGLVALAGWFAVKRLRPRVAA